MTYELIDLESFNVVGSYSDADDALLAVVEAADVNGEDDAALLSLAAYNDSGNVELIAKGADLLQLARDRLHAAHSTAAIA